MRAVELEVVCRRHVRCGRIRRLCPRVLLRGSRGIPGPVPRRRVRGRTAPVEPEGVRAAECGPRDCGGVGRRRRRAAIAHRRTNRTMSKGWHLCMPFDMHKCQRSSFIWTDAFLPPDEQPDAIHSRLIIRLRSNTAKGMYQSYFFTFSSAVNRPTAASP